MCIRDIAGIIPQDKYIWLDDETCEGLGLIKNSFFRVGRMLGMDTKKILKIEPMGIGGFRVKLDLSL